MINRTIFFASLTFAGALVIGYAPAANAQFLVGAEIFRTNNLGVGTTDFLYSTDSTTPFYGIGLVPANGNTTGKGIDIPLSAGLNSFTFSHLAGQTANPGSFAAIGLFFSSTAASYNPTSPNARVADLTVYAPTTSSTSFSTQTAGTSVTAYDLHGLMPANGLTSINVGGSPISITAFSIDTSPAGSFTLSVGSVAPATTPEPGTVGLGLAMAGSGLLCAMRRRNARRRA